MFTGIVKHQGEVAHVDWLAGGNLRLAIAWPGLSTAVEPGPAIGDSVAVDGACLTVAARDGDRLTFEAVPETLRKTTLAGFRPGRRVHLEAALVVGSPLGSHWVQGHVDGVGEVVSLDAPNATSGDVRLEIAVPEAWSGDVMSKGSITIDGVGLTVGEVQLAAAPPERRLRLSVYLIPHTLAVTHLSVLRSGGMVNVELDAMGRWIGRHVERWLAAHGAPSAGPRGA